MSDETFQKLLALHPSELPAEVQRLASESLRHGSRLIDHDTIVTKLTEDLEDVEDMQISQNSRIQDLEDIVATLTRKVEPLTASADHNRKTNHRVLNMLHGFLEVQKITDLKQNAIFRAIAKRDFNFSDLEDVQPELSPPVEPEKKDSGP